MVNYDRLTEPFNDSELEWKPQSVGIKNGNPWAMILCYVQARAIQNRLDEVFGPMNWKDEYRFEQNGVICRLSVYCNEKKEWIAKENGSPETDIESFKGGISGAFKRVASSGYGIGRYLYELDVTFAECSMTKQNGYKQAKTKDNQYFYWRVPTSIDGVSKTPQQQPPAQQQTQPAQPAQYEARKAPRKPLNSYPNQNYIEQIVMTFIQNGVSDEAQQLDILHGFNDTGFFGIKSEAQLKFFLSKINQHFNKTPKKKAIDESFPIENLPEFP